MIFELLIRLRYLLHFNKIRVHIWGGLGSQLFAVVIVRRILQKYSGFKIELFIHRAGVTERKLEIPELDRDIVTIREVSDFNPRINQDVRSRNFGPSAWLRKIVRRQLLFLGFLSSVSNELEFRRLKPWLVSTRGHYSNISVSHDEALWIISYLFKKDLFLEEPKIFTCSIHFRLGDLLTLKEKTPLHPNDLKMLLEQLDDGMPIIVLSDSPTDVTSSYLEAFIQQDNLHFMSLPTLQTVKTCMLSTLFIGTSSKISLWITIFRYALNPQNVSYMPDFSRKQIETSIRKNSSVRFYKTSNSA